MVLVPVLVTICHFLKPTSQLQKWITQLKLSCMRPRTWRAQMCHTFLVPKWVPVSHLKGSYVTLRYDRHHGKAVCFLQDVAVVLGVTTLFFCAKFSNPGSWELALQCTAQMVCVCLNECFRNVLQLHFKWFCEEWREWGSKNKNVGTFPLFMKYDRDESRLKGLPAGTSLKAPVSSYHKHKSHHDGT